VFSLFRRSQYQTLNTIQVSQKAIEQNHQALQVFHPEARVCPVLKSNAYGHGLKTVAKVFDSLNCPYLTVDSLFEAYELQKAGVKTKILILGYTHPDNFKAKKLPFEYVVYDLELAKTINQHQPGCNIHVFVDTGMCREGVTLSELPTFLKELQQLKQLRITGICSHLANADNPQDQAFTTQQIKNFQQALKLIRELGIEPQWRHVSASGGAFKVKDPTFNMIRAGLAHYGINPLETKDPESKNLQLLPVLRFTSTIVQIKDVQKGDRVGYNGTFTATRPMKIGLLPAGYYEGVDRRLSNQGVIKVGETFCKILGRVSMNMTLIDLSDVPTAKVGDEVTIYSEVNDDLNSVSKAAKDAKTISYELLVHLAESVRRELK